MRRPLLLLRTVLVTIPYGTLALIAHSWLAWLFAGMVIGIAGFANAVLFEVTFEEGRQQGEVDGVERFVDLAEEVQRYVDAGEPDEDDEGAGEAGPPDA